MASAMYIDSVQDMSPANDGACMPLAEFAPRGFIKRVASLHAPLYPGNMVKERQVIVRSKPPRVGRLYLG